MIDLSLRFVNNFKIEIQCKDEMILESFMQHLKTTETKTKRIMFDANNKVTFISAKSVRSIFKEELVESKLFTKNKDKLYIGAGFVDYVAFHISSLCKNHDINLKYTPSKPSKIVINDKWKNIYLNPNHPKGVERGKMQYADFHTLTTHASGIAELFTGYGKTELLLGIADCSNERTVILVPNDNGIRDEILNRAKIYNVDVGNEDWTKNINVINVIVFMRRTITNEAKEWLKDVKIALGDECHHYSADSYIKFFELLKNVQRSHGFSASTDVATGRKVKAGSTDIRDLGVNTSKVVNLCGSVRITRNIQIPVSLVKVNTQIADFNSVINESSWSKQLDYTIVNFKMAKLIKNIFDLDSSRVFFIPIHKKESGEALYHNLIDLGYTGVLWTGENFKVNGEEIKTADVLVTLKEIMRKQSFTFIISTKMEGIDLPNLDAVIPLVGANYRMVVQPLGRSARNADMIIYLIYDRNNAITISQANIRLKTIEKEYNIISNKRISIDVYDGL